MNATCLRILLYSFLIVSQPVVAANVYYNEPVSLTGKLIQSQGRDCCRDGKETEVKFPALRLREPITISSQPGSDPANEEETERGVRIVQLVLRSPEDWTAYESLKGKQARLECSLFHSQSGHHLTKVLCTALKIESTSKPQASSAR